MATTALVVRSERFGLSIAATSSPAQTSSANWSESFSLPAGFGDCGILKVAIYVNTIQTIITTISAVTPSLFLVATDVRDFVPMSGSRMAVYSSTAAQSSLELERPTAWYAGEILTVQLPFLDTGAGNTSIINVAVGLMRFRN